MSGGLQRQLVYIPGGAARAKHSSSLQLRRVLLATQRSRCLPSFHHWSSMTDKILCKYYMHGACKFGKDCRFSHDLSKVPNMVCKYWLAGHCAYGDACRYDHARPSWAPPKHAAAPPTSYAAPPIPKPAVDPLEDQIRLSQLRLGASSDSRSSRGNRDTAPAADPGSAAGAAAAAAGGMPVPVPLLLGGPSTPTTAQQAERQLGAAGEEYGGWDEQGWEGEGYEGEGYYAGDGEGEYGEGEYEGDYVQGGEYYGEEEGEVFDGSYYCYGEEEGAEGQQWEGGGSWGPEEEEQPHSGQAVAAAAAAGTAAAGGAWQQGDSGAWQRRVAAAAAGGGAEEEEKGGWGGADCGGAAATAAAPLGQRSLCMQYLLGGSCSKGAACNLVHGDLCEHCHRCALHPHDAAARAAHVYECRLRHERLAARARSAHVECCICLEPVLQKAEPRERKFGLMACDHAFCLGCIRNWRQKVDGPADLDSALRTCPVCRTTTHFITPSATWPATPGEKELIVSGYKAKLGIIDCKHFAFGEGTCPFGTSCFYRHAYRDGRLEEPSLRKAAVDEGEVKVLQPVRLSDFLSASTVGQQLLGVRGRR